jgi:hypothetical protein
MAVCVLSLVGKIKDPRWVGGILFLLRMSFVTDSIPFRPSSPSLDCCSCCSFCFCVTTFSLLDFCFYFCFHFIFVFILFYFPLVFFLFSRLRSVVMTPFSRAPRIIKCCLPVCLVCVFCYRHASPKFGAGPFVLWVLTRVTFDCPQLPCDTLINLRKSFSFRPFYFFLFFWLLATRQ